MHGSGLANNDDHDKISNNAWQQPGWDIETTKCQADNGDDLHGLSFENGSAANAHLLAQQV